MDPAKEQKKWYWVYYNGKPPVARLIRPQLVAKMEWYAIKHHYDVIFQEQ